MSEFDDTLKSAFEKAEKAATKKVDPVDPLDREIRKFLHRLVNQYLCRDADQKSLRRKGIELVQKMDERLKQRQQEYDDSLALKK